MGLGVTSSEWRRQAITKIYRRERNASGENDVTLDLS